MGLMKVIVEIEKMSNLLLKISSLWIFLDGQNTIILPIKKRVYYSNIYE